jgi:hypothetical protein
MHEPFVTLKYNQYMFNNYINCFLAFLGIGLWAVDTEFYLDKRDTSKDYRVKLLYINLLVNALLSISITFSYIQWISYNNLVKPKLQVGITRKYGAFQQKNLILKFFDSRIFHSYILEIWLNLLSPLPWLFDQYYDDKYYEDGNKIYANSEILTAMVIFRSYHIVKIYFQMTYFMTPRAERLTRIFSPSCK